MGETGCDIWGKGVKSCFELGDEIGVEKQEEFISDIWGKRGATYGENGVSRKKEEFISDIWGKRGATYGEKGSKKQKRGRRVREEWGANTMCIPMCGGLIPCVYQCVCIPMCAELRSRCLFFLRSRKLRSPTMCDVSQRVH